MGLARELAPKYLPEGLFYRKISLAIVNFQHFLALNSVSCLLTRHHELSRLAVDFSSAGMVAIGVPIVTRLIGADISLAESALLE